jgi:hypothetical protein
MSLDLVEKGVLTSYLELKVAWQQGHEFERKNQLILPTKHLHHKIPEKRGNLGSSSVLPPRLVEEEAQGLEEPEEMASAGEADTAGDANTRGRSSLSMKLQRRRRSRGAMQRPWGGEGEEDKETGWAIGHRIVAFFFCSAEPTCAQRR